MPRSPEPARRQLLDAALRLFARHGIAAVSLREIRLAAKQANAGALHYHFGSKDGLLKALLERELPPLIARRRALIAEAMAGRVPDLRALAASFVLPFAEMATGGARDKAVVLLLSHLHEDVKRSFAEIMGLVGDTAVFEASDLLLSRIDSVPRPLLAARLTIAHSIFLHAAALRARGGARGGGKRAFHLGDDAFRATLVDMFLGALTAPDGAAAKPKPARAKRASRSV